MFILISVFILIASVLLVLIVLIQNSKGGGLASNFASSAQIMGVQKTSDFLEKATWTLAILVLGLSLVSIMTIDRKQNKAEVGTELREAMEKSKVNPVAGFNPTNAPQNNGIQPK